MASPESQELLSPISRPVPEIFLAHHGEVLYGPMREWKESGRLPPVLLLIGKSGIGKRTVAYWLSQWILCERNGFSTRPGFDTEEPGLFGAVETSPAAPATELKPCGECAQCQRARKGSWVDFTEVLPEQEASEGSGTLKIDQFRELKNSLGFGGHEGSHKIILIGGCDRMTPQAANSLLKLLEEPPRGWIFLLTAGDSTLLLPTVLSRCQTLRLRPFTESQIRELLSLGGTKPERQPICAELAQGSWGRALKLADDEAWAQRKVIFDFIKSPAAALNSMVDWASQSPGHFELILDQLEQVASELVRWSVSPTRAEPENYPWINRDGKAAFVTHARDALKRFGSVERACDHWIQRAERIARARGESRAPLNRKLLAQDVLMPWTKTGPQPGDQ